MRNPVILTALAAALACGAPATPAATPAAKVEVKATPKTEPEPQPTDTAVKDPKPASPLKWTIAAEPETLSMKKIGELRLRITVTNEGDAIADPLATLLHFSVDGEASTSLSLAFGNGGHGKEWTELAPGKVAEKSRVGVGFTNELGEHVIAISDGTTELARAVVHLEP